MSPHRCSEHIKPQTMYNRVDEREERLRRRECDRVLRRERKRLTRSKAESLTLLLKLPCT